MSTADLYEDGFPHGTKEGYEKGCRGSACPGLIENGISCLRAFQRYSGDYDFRKKVDAGITPAAIVAAEEGDTKPTVKAVVPSPIPLEKHGTPSGYRAGCRREDCPGIASVGKSCRTAVAEYQRELNARKAAKATPKPRPILQPVEPAAPVVEPPEEVQAPPAPVQLVVDNVNHPTHYTSDPSGVECITITRHRNFDIGNAIKYLWRAGLKDQDSTVEDLRKAIFYIEDEIARLESTNGVSA